MDDLKLLRQMRGDVPPPSPQAISAAGQRLAQAASARQRSPFPGIRRGGLREHPRRLRLIAAGLCLVLIAGVLAVLAAQPGDQPPGTGIRHMRLAAWAVTRRPGGLLLIKVRELRDAAGLQALLRSDGVPARVKFARRPFQATTSPEDIPRSCTMPRMSGEAMAKLESRIEPQYPPPGKNGIGTSLPGLVFAIRPAAIPHGIGIYFKAFITHPKLSAGDWVLNLVKTSPRCTGSAG